MTNVICDIGRYKYISIELNMNLAADGLLVLLAAALAALDRFDAEAGPSSGAGALARGTDGFLPVLEQLHQQGELGTAAHTQSQTGTRQALLIY